MIWQASDDLGNLPINHKNGKEWLVGRDTIGTVVLAYTVFPPRTTKPIRQSEPAFELRSNQGGLLGVGFSFILIPPGGKFYHITFSWDLSLSLSNTRAIWTYGEGPSHISRIGPASLLTDFVYMVGPTCSNPPILIPGSISDYYGYYWFGTLSDNVELIKDIHHSFFLKASEFFNSTPSKDNPYRTFILNTASTPSFNNTTLKTATSSLTTLGSRKLKITISFAVYLTLLSTTSSAPPSSPLPKTQQQIFLFQGTKHTLSIYLPFRPPQQFRTGNYFSSTINTLLSRYYTNPLLYPPTRPTPFAGIQERFRFNFWERDAGDESLGFCS
jgi:hypothetical protein